MARPRSQSTKKSTSAAKRTTAKRTTASKTASAKSSTGTRAKKSTQLKCPECGASSKTFASAANLGSHRRNAHGVAGASARTQTRLRAATTGTARRGRPATTAARSTNSTNGRRRGRPPGSPNRPKTGTVNRDALLQAFLPTGLPPTASTIRSLSAWLDKAEPLLDELERIAGSH
jgi:DNA-binding protein HU-beta